MKRFDPDKIQTSNSPKCEWPYLLNDNECTFVIQDNKPCNFDVEDCANSTLCIDFKATLTCDESIELGPFYPQCDINSALYC